MVRVTDTRLVDLFSGARGTTDRMMTILAIETEWETGDRLLTLLDTGGRRYGLISEDSQVAFDVAPQIDRETYAFITDDSGQMSDASDGYRFI